MDPTTEEMDKGREEAPEQKAGLFISEDLMKHARRYHEIREMKRALEAQVADLDAERDQIGEEMKSKMGELELQKFNIKGIGTFYLQASFYPKVIGDPVKVISWLDEQGAGDIAPRTIGRTAFKEFYQDRVENDLPVPPVELVEAATEVGLRLRGSKK